jgi:Na+-driven multidrug efflux pump
MLDGISPATLLPKAGFYKDIVKQGFPASLNSLTVGVGIYVINKYISLFGPEGVAAYSAAVRIEQVVLMPSIGLNTATLTIVAQNYGAGKFERIPETISKVLKYGAWIMLSGGAVLFILAPQLMRFFSKDPVVISQGTDYLYIAAFMLYSYVILYTNVSALQGLKRPMFAFYMGLARQIVAPVAVFHLLCVILGWGVMGVWWVSPSSPGRRPCSPTSMPEG